MLHVSELVLYCFKYMCRTVSGKSAVLLQRDNAALFIYAAAAPENLVLHSKYSVSHCLRSFAALLLCDAAQFQFQFRYRNSAVLLQILCCTAPDLVLHCSRSCAALLQILCCTAPDLVLHCSRSCAALLLAVVVNCSEYRAELQYSRYM